MLRGYKYRIYPTEEQKKFFALSFAANRWWWNYCLGIIKPIWEYNKDKEKCDRKHIPSCQYELARKLPELKNNNEETAWIKNVDAKSLEYTAIDLDETIHRYFKGLCEFPKYKSADCNGSYTIPVKKERQKFIDWKHGFVKVGKAGELKCILHRKFNGIAKSITVRKESYDYYEISILVDDGCVVDIEKPTTYEGTVGIDMGSKRGNKGGNAILSDGTRFDVVNNTRLEKKRKRLQRKLAKKEWKKTGKKKFSNKYNKEVDVKEPSNNYRKLKDEIAKLYAKEARKRAYNTHQISNYVVKNDAIDTVAIEDLNVAGMMKNHKNSRSIANANIRELGRQLEYKCPLYGKKVVKVGRFFPSTKTCHVCGYKYDVGTKREWVCPNCGTHHDRDINAAINIKNEGYRLITETK